MQSEKEADLLDEREELAKVAGVILVEGADLADVLVLGLVALELLWGQRVPAQPHSKHFNAGCNLTAAKYPATCMYSRQTGTNPFDKGTER